MIRLLMVAQSFPPVGGSHATRTSAFATRLSSEFRTVGLAPTIGDDYPHRDEKACVPILVMRTFPGLGHKVAHGNVSGDNHKVTPKSFNFLTPTRRRLLLLAALLYRKVEIVDSYFDWIPHLASRVRDATKDPNTVVLSMSMPNSVHVGTWLGLFGRRNPWIVDVADPWSLDASRARGRWRHRVESWLESRILRRADAVLFVTQATAADYVRAMPWLEPKVHVVRMGYWESDNAVEPKSFDRTTVFYAGSLPSENRDALPFLDTISDFGDVRFMFAGPCTTIVRDHFADHLPRNVRLVPWLSHDEFVSYLRGADVSVIIGNTNPQQVPGKVYQNIGLANRILYISALPTDLDESLELLQGRAVSCSNDPVDVKRGIREALAAGTALANGRTAYSWEVVSDQVVNVVRAAARKAPGGARWNR